MIRSIGGIVFAFDLKKSKAEKWKFLLAAGIVGTVFSLILILNPLFTGRVLVILIGVTLIIGGGFGISLSIILKTVKDFGKYWINTTASTIGLCMTLVLGLIFIPRAAEIGYIEAIQTAGVITSISYFSSLVTCFILFFLKTPAKFKDLLISKSDLQLLKKEFSVLRKRFRKKES
ncbi:hypothetical protein LJB75_00775 [Bacteroidales bacterium OttesenSCG-928-L19]|nr:hypothetical protein [Bacteroidales bacterium OttesenSCG-928-L19]